MPSVVQKQDPEATECPEWLNAALLEEALHLSGEKDLKVARIAVKFATAPGDNYGSALYRVTAILDDGGERSFLVKAPPLTEVIAQTIAEVGLFPRETNMLTRVLPQMEALLEEVAPGRYPPFAPRCPLHGTTPVDFLVLEDLAPQDFKMADRHRGLGLRHSLFAFRSLARYHAASVALLAKDPSIGDALDNPLRKQTDTFQLFFNSALDNTAKACRSWPGYEDLGDVIDAFKVNAVSKITELHDPKPGAFNVIMHGDFWANNMMFRYQKGKPKDMRLIDFQTSHVASPALDILYFLTTSVSEDVSENYLDLVLREYHSELNEVLSLLGQSAPTLKELLADIEVHGPYAMLSVSMLLPIIKATKTPDIDAVAQGDADSSSYMYKDPTVKRWLTRLLPEFRDKGWLQS